MRQPEYEIAFWWSQLARLHAFSDPMVVSAQSLICASTTTVPVQHQSTGFQGRAK